MQRLRVEASLASMPTFYYEVRKSVRNISRVIKACLRLYLGDGAFKTQVDDYIRKHKDRVL